MRQYITSARGEGVKFVKKLISDSSFRRERNLVVVEGERTIADLPAYVRVESVYILKEKEDKFSRFFGLCGDVNICTENVMRAISSAVTPPGVLAVVQLPLQREQGDRLIVLDGITDPGNMGTVIRTAAALGGWDVLCVDCCSATSPKAVRAGMGGIFRVNVKEISGEEAEKYTRGYKIFALDMHGENVYNIKKDEFTGRFAVAAGGEAFGLSDGLRKRADKIISLPMPGDMESLNAAVSLAVTLYTVEYALK